MSKNRFQSPIDTIRSTIGLVVKKLLKIFFWPRLPSIGLPEGKILAIDILSQNRLNTIEKMNKFIHFYSYSLGLGLGLGLGL